MTATKGQPVGAPESGTQGRREVVRLDALIVVADYQIRKATNPTTVASYVKAMRAGTVLPPVTVGDMQGALVLLDGHHRLAAHRELERIVIDAAISAVTAKEARWIAAAANMKHGLPLRKAELRQAFKAFVRAGHHRDSRGRLMSIREGARAFGAVSHTSYRVWMQDDFPRIAKEWTEETPHGGGLNTPRSLPPDFAATATSSLAAALAAARGVTCPHDRGTLVADFRAAVRDLEEGGEFVMPDF